jgi:hypothetical protein
MSNRVRRFGAVAAFALALTASPVTSLAYPIWAPVDAAPQQTVSADPVRSLLDLVALQDASLWSALQSVYSDSYIPTACDPSC